MKTETHQLPLTLTPQQEYISPRVMALFWLTTLAELEMWLRIPLAVLMLAICMLPSASLAEEAPAAIMGKPIKSLPADFEKRTTALLEQWDSYQTFGMLGRELALSQEVRALYEEYYGPNDLRVAIMQQWIDVTEKKLKLSRQQQRELATAHQQVATARESAETWFEYEAAIDLLAQAHATFQKHLGNENVAIEQAVQLQGTYLQASGRFQEAEGLLAVLERQLQKTLSSQHPTLARARVARAHSLLSLQRYDEAEQLLDTTVPLLIRCFGRRHIATAWGQLAQARLYNATDRPQLAEQTTQAAIASYGYQATTDVTLRLFTELAVSQRLQGRTLAVQSTLKRPFAILSDEEHKNICSRATLDALINEELAILAAVDESQQDLDLRRQEHHELRQRLQDRVKTKRKKRTDSASFQSDTRTNNLLKSPEHKAEGSKQLFEMIESLKK